MTLLFLNKPGQRAAAGYTDVTTIIIGTWTLLWIWEKDPTLENQTEHQKLPSYLSSGKLPETDLNC